MTSGRDDHVARGTDLSFENDQDGERPRRSESKVVRDQDARSRPSRSDKKEQKPEVGLALRSIYQRTVDESIPPEMLDLLGKLG